MSCSLEQLSNYQNESVVRRFCWEVGESLERGQFVFEHTKRFLWVCAQRHIDRQAGRQVPPPIPILMHMWAMDEMWHSFILHTVDYEKFCEEELGQVVHHNPGFKALEGEPSRYDPVEFYCIQQVTLDAYRQGVEYISRKLSKLDAWYWFIELPRQFPIDPRRINH
jgi:hypothetical protein